MLRFFKNDKFYKMALLYTPQLIDINMYTFVLKRVCTNPKRKKDTTKVLFTVSTTRLSLPSNGDGNIIILIFNDLRLQAQPIN